MTNAICLRSDGRRVSDETIDRPRRRFLALAAAGALMPLAGTSRAAAPAPIKAIAFDAFPIFDPRPVLAAVRQRFPAEGEALGKLWFAKLFPYTWLRTAAEQYAGFESVALEALDAAAGTLGMTLQSADREAAIAAFSQLALWPDAAGRLAEFRRRGLRLAFLSNLPEAMLRTNMRRTGIEPFFQAVLSTDRVRAFKPAPKAYRLAPRGVRAEERGNRLRRVCGMGRGRGKLVRLSDGVGQSPGAAGRAVRRAAGSRGPRPGGAERGAGAGRLTAAAQVAPPIFRLPARPFGGPLSSQRRRHS